MSRRTLLPALLLLTAAIGGVALWIGEDEEALDPAQGAAVFPAGRWHRTAPATENSDEMARLLSLPYTSGSRPAAGDTGVLAHDRERTQPGVNLYVSGHDPEAILMDNGGRVLHRWRHRFEDAFPDRATTLETGFFRRVHLLPDGDLIALYQGGGLIRLGPESELRWSVGQGFYNDFFVATDGTITAIGKSAREIPETDPPAYFLEDFIQRLDAAGRLGERTSLLGAFRDSSFAPLLEPIRARGDILHSNTITVFDGSLAERSELYAAGNTLVSLREVDLIGILDPTGRDVLWAQRGPWNAQHEPVLLPDGQLLLFDNQGADGMTRVLEVDPGSGEVTWEYRGPEARPLDSPEAGSVQRLANGNTLITESEQGRAFEIDAEGGIVWEFASPHRAGPNRELVATLFEVVRLPEDAVQFLRARRSHAA